MPDNSRTPPEKSPPEHQRTLPKHPVFAPNWEHRVEEARYKREMVLAAKRAKARSSKSKDAAKAATLNGATKLKPPPILGPAKKEAQASVEAKAQDRVTRARLSMRRLQLPRSLAGFGLVAFLFAVGLGFGAVLALEILRDGDDGPTRIADVKTTKIAPAPEAAAPMPPYVDAPTSAVPASTRTAPGMDDQLRESHAVATGAAFPQLAMERSGDEPVLLQDAALRRETGDALPRSAPSIVQDAPSTIASSPDDLPETAQLGAVTSTVDAQLALTAFTQLAVPDRETAISVNGASFGQVPQPLEVFMHVPNGVSSGRIEGYVAQLGAAGVEVADIGREGFRVSATHLRFYSPETADHAQAIAADLGVEAHDFSDNFRDDGRIEIWVSGRPKAVSPTPRRRFNSTTPPYDSSVADR